MHELISNVGLIDLSSLGGDILFQILYYNFSFYVSNREGQQCLYKVYYLIAP